MPPALISGVTTSFGEMRVATLPAVSATGDNSEAFAKLLRDVRGASVVLFPDIAAARLDEFFHLRLAQILENEGPLPALSVVTLIPDDRSRRLGGGFAARFRSSWPFERCIFVTHGSEPTADLTAALGLPVSRIDHGGQAPEVLRSAASAGQPIALQIQPIWKRCGSTTLFLNQIEQLVQAGFLTIRVYRDGHLRRGPTLDAQMSRIIPENNEHAGAHIDVAAVPYGPHHPHSQFRLQRNWARRMVEEAACRIDDRAVAEAAAKSECVIANHIHTVGLALQLAPRAKLLLDVQDDQAASQKQAVLLHGGSQEQAERAAVDADAVQRRILAIPDFCTHVSLTEMQRLGPASRQAALVLPRVYVRPLKSLFPERFDLLLFGDAHMFNVEGLRWFLDQVWRPHLLQSELRIAIVGRAGQRLDPATYDSPNLHLAGFVDDLDVFRSSCRMTVVPDRGGTGLPVKMLATLAASHPVSTTTIGLRGFGPPIAALLPAFDDAAGLAADILSLLADPKHLEERRARVRQAHQAIQFGPSYLDCLDAISPPTKARRKVRAGQWASIVRASPQPDPTPYNFEIGADPFPLSGTAWDHHVVIDGWHGPEAWGRWTDGPDATVRIAMGSALNEPAALELDLVPSPLGAPLTVMVNEVELATFEPQPGPNVIELPMEALGDQTSFVAKLHVGEAVLPAELGNSIDERVLGIGLCKIRLVSRKPSWTTLGDRIEISSRLALPWDLLLSGWHSIEDWGVWTKGISGSLCLNFARPLRKQIELELDLVPALVEASLVVSVNDHSLSQGVPVRGSNRWTLPDAWTRDQTRLVIGLSVSETICPAEAGRAGDNRVIGIGLRGLRLLAAAEPARCRLGDRVSLARTTAPRQVLISGWHDPEPWGCWSSGAEATLKILFDAPLRGSFRLDLNIAPSPVTLTLTLAVNGLELAAVEPDPGRNSWVLPRSCTDFYMGLMIQLRVSRTFRPVEINPSLDDRVLGIGVQAFGLHPVPFRTCAADETISLSSGGHAHDLLRSGWHKSEDWGCWSRAPDASICLEFHAALHGDVALELDLVPPLLNQPVTVMVDGTVLQAGAVRDGINRWSIPRERSERRTTLLVRLLIERTVCPADVNGASDDRMLGVGVRSVAVRHLAAS